MDYGVDAFVAEMKEKINTMNFSQNALKYLSTHFYDQSGLSHYRHTIHQKIRDCPEAIICTAVFAWSTNTTFGMGRKSCVEHIFDNYFQFIQDKKDFPNNMLIDEKKADIWLKKKKGLKYTPTIETISVLKSLGVFHIKYYPEEETDTESEPEIFKFTPPPPEEKTLDSILGTKRPRDVTPKSPSPTIEKKRRVTTPKAAPNRADYTFMKTMGKISYGFQKTNWTELEKYLDESVRLRYSSWKVAINFLIYEIGDQKNHVLFLIKRHAIRKANSQGSGLELRGYWGYVISQLAKVKTPDNPKDVKKIIDCWKYYDDGCAKFFSR